MSVTLDSGYRGVWPGPPALDTADDALIRRLCIAEAEAGMQSPRALAADGYFDFARAVALRFHAAKLAATEGQV